MTLRAQPSSTWANISGRCSGAFVDRVTKPFFDTPRCCSMLMHDGFMMLCRAL